MLCCLNDGNDDDDELYSCKDIQFLYILWIHTRIQIVFFIFNFYIFCILTKRHPSILLHVFKDIFCSLSLCISIVIHKFRISDYDVSEKITSIITMFHILYHRFLLCKF